VVFLADDAGWGDYRQSGNTQVRTPHIDGLAQQGVTLDRFFVCPVCAPTRAEFLCRIHILRKHVVGLARRFHAAACRQRTGIAAGLQGSH
jgi:hypothetical protein